MSIHRAITFSLLPLSLLFGCTSDSHVTQSSELTTTNSGLASSGNESRDEVQERSKIASNQDVQNKTPDTDTLILEHESPNERSLGDEQSSTTEKQPETSNVSNSPLGPESEKGNEKKTNIASSTVTEENPLEGEEINEPGFHPPFKEVEKAKLPKTLPSIQAPEHLEHPLSASMGIMFLLGEDSKGYYLYGEGKIAEGTFQKFIRYVDHYKLRNIELDRIMIHSPGGLMHEAMLVGRYMQENNWSSDSDKHMRCYSACGFIFASGTTKRMQSGAEVGFHRPYLPQIEDTPEIISAMYERYIPFWIEIDGDPTLFNKFMKNYGRDDMLILTTEDANDYLMVDIYK
ncbi:hypothetical protein L1D22_19765 [Vibrio sp. Isolate34]|uniref:hypothetical protein n=1 Tax=Vibrio sp. Isolate34 TaxID=2908540 RepID=UPI001EFD5D38|nr:hypothetical protein [Vibrio sp. Isolate34]MCG9642082.1 hypothetical protein [Vibrio sp. Isolate34]